MTPMRLAVIEPAPFGGLLHYGVQLADALAARGHDVDLVVARDNELSGRTGPARRLPILAPGTPPPAGLQPSRTQVLQRRARTALRLAVTWRRIIGCVRQGRYDAVILNGSLELAPVAAAALLLTAVKGRTRVAHVGHNVRLFNRWRRGDLFAGSPLTVALLRRVYPAFDLVFVHGERSRAEFAQVWRGARLAIIPHGDETLFADDPPPPSPEPRILFFGDWRKVKGLSVLMEAFDRLAARRPEVTLTIAGAPSPEEGESERVIRWAGERAGRVEVIPRYVPVADVREVFARARVAVMPYLVGYQSGVLHLAMTMGRAVVASDVGDLGSAVDDGRTGRLVPPGDPERLAAALEDIVCDPGLAEELGARGRERVLARSGWDHVAARAEEALAALGGPAR